MTKMKTIRMKSLLAVVLALGAIQGTALATPTSPASGLDRLKPLVGTWEGKSPEGKPMRVTFTSVSEGTAILESHEGNGHSDSMVTLFHPDGDSLFLTHYCSMGNQPRMRASHVAGDAKEIVFSYVDSTNLAKSDAPHMHKLLMRFDDAEHLTQEWTFKNGAEEKVATLHFTRKKV
jgi:hypothetical protein